MDHPDLVLQPEAFPRGLQVCDACRVCVTKNISARAAKQHHRQQRRTWVRRLGAESELQGVPPVGTAAQGLDFRGRAEEHPRAKAALDVVDEPIDGGPGVGLDLVLGPQPADDLGEQQVLPDITKVREMRIRHA